MNDPADLIEEFKRQLASGAHDDVARGAGCLRAAVEHLEKAGLPELALEAFKVHQQACRLLHRMRDAG